MILKKSMYDIEVDKLDTGDILLFNSATASYGIMNLKTQRLFDELNLIDEANLKDAEDKNSINIMKKEGFLVNKEMDEYMNLKTLGEISKYNSTGFSLTIAPTMDCNMACPYCYENKTKKIMDENTKNQLIKYVESRICNSDVKSFFVTWYGGEPLLQKNIILDLSKAFIHICNENKVKYSAGIITNGTLLDYETAKMLKNECYVSTAQVTIDGLKKVNNTRRLLKDGSDSFEMITNNIDNCKALIHFSIRVNVDKNNIDETKKLVDYFINEKKWKDGSVNYYFAPVEDITDYCNIDNNSTCYSYEEFGQINSGLLRLMYENGNMDSINITYPKVRLISCGAITYDKGYVVDSDGDLYKCWNMIGMKDKTVGDIFNGPILNKEYAEFLKLDLPQKCESCDKVPADRYAALL